MSARKIHNLYFTTKAKHGCPLLRACDFNKKERTQRSEIS